MECYEEIRTTKNSRRQWLKQYSGMTIKQYATLLTKQESRCAICLRPQEKPFVDHCHRTQRVRGLLCLDCNLGIGLLGDSPETARRAAEYLKRFNGR